MNVLYVVHSFPPFHWRGTEVYTWELATAMAAHHSPHVFHLVDDPAAAAPTLEEAEFRGLPVHRVRMRLTPTEPENYFFNPAQEKLFADLLNRVRPDVVHFVYFAGGLSLNLPRLAREGGAKTIITVTDFAGICPRAQLTDRDGWYCYFGPRAGLRCGWCLFGHSFIDGHSRIDRRLRDLLPRGLAARFHNPGLDLIRKRWAAAKSAFAEAQLVVYPNENCAQHYLKEGFSERHLVMDYGIDTRPFAGHRKTPSDVPRIGFVGQLLPHKGLHELAQAAAELKEDFRLLIYGDAENPEARRYLETFTLPRQAELRGTFPFERMNEVVQDIDILVVPSTWMENSPLIVKYGLITRTCTLVSDQSGMIAKWIHPALHQFLSGNVAHLQSKLEEMLAEVRAGRALEDGDTGVTDIAAQAKFFAAAYEGLE